MNARQVAREKVIGAVLHHLSSQHFHDQNPGDYGGLASSEMALDMLDEALAVYVQVANG